MKVQGALSSVIDPVLNPLRSVIPPSLRLTSTVLITVLVSQVLPATSSGWVALTFPL